MKIMKTLNAVVLAITISLLMASCGGATGTVTGGTVIPEQLTAVENALLALINAERTAAGLPELVRDTGLDRIEEWYGTEMASQNHLGHVDANGRGAEERARYYSGDSTVRCSEIVQWWGGTPSGQVHYDGYMASSAHHSAYMEEGLFNLGPTSSCGVVAMRGTGPIGSQFAGSAGSYTAVLLCDKPLTLIIDPFSE